MVDRIHNNYALQVIANSFLANPTTSATFATILVEYLLARLQEMGCEYNTFKHSPKYVNLHNKCNFNRRMYICMQTFMRNYYPKFI